MCHKANIHSLIHTFIDTFIDTFIHFWTTKHITTIDANKSLLAIFSLEYVVVQYIKINKITQQAQHSFVATGLKNHYFPALHKR